MYINLFLKKLITFSYDFVENVFINSFAFDR